MDGRVHISTILGYVKNGNDFIIFQPNCSAVDMREYTPGQQSAL